MLDSQIVRDAAWRELESALNSLNRVPVQVGLGKIEAVDMLLDDIRRNLGGLALLLSDGPDAVGYAKLLTLALDCPMSAAEATITGQAPAVTPDPRVWQRINDALDEVPDARA